MTIATRSPLSSPRSLVTSLITRSAPAGARWIVVLVALAGLIATSSPATAAEAAGVGPVAETVQVAGLTAPVRLVRDVEGVPHVFATNEHDLYFVQGWVHAEDRLFQMDVSRRQANGTLAELFGPAALDDDVLLRTLGLGRAAHSSLGVISQEALAALAAYAEGVNAWVAANPLPLEYQALELTSFAPWTQSDSLAIAKLIAFGLSFDLDDLDRTEALLAYFFAGELVGFDGTALFFEDLFRTAPFDPAVTVLDALGAPTGARGTTGLSTLGLEALARRAVKRLGPTSLELIRSFRQRAETVAPVARAFETDERTIGSNEWAVAPRHSAEGKPLLANDPHLALDSPATFYPIHLRAPRAGINVAGSGFPGVPYVILGQNQFLAWGATTNPLDVTDLFLETVVVDPASPSGLSTVYRGQNEPIVPLPVEFRANQLGDGVPDNLVVVPPGGGIPQAVLIVPRRNNGPIIELDVAAGAALSVQYTGFSATREIDAFRRWNRARNLDEFVAGLQSFDVGSQNWAVADVYGNIAYFSSAELPLREDLQAGGVDGLPPYFLRDGTGDLAHEWLPVENGQPGQAIPYEILPFAEMPQVVNPPTGYFVNANNDPIGTTLDNNPVNQQRPGGGIYYLSPGYSTGFRAGRIDRLLSAAIAAGPVTVADMQRIQADVALLDAEVLVPYILDAFAAADAPGAPAELARVAGDPRVAEAVDRLAAWDFTTPTGIPQGFDAADVAGNRLAPDEEEVEASVAATIYSTWRGRILANSIDAPLDALDLPKPGSQQAMTALRQLFENGGVSASGLDLFDVPGVPDSAASRDVVILASLAEALDRLAGPEFAQAFGGSTDQNDYRWGRLHRVVFEHPLGPPFSVPPAFDGFPHPLGPALPGIPTDGGFGAVDASNHSARADEEDEFGFGSGPVRRYVGQPGFGRLSIEGWSALPGGASGVPGSPFYLNLLPAWLTNEAYPVRQSFADLAGAVADRRVLVPAD